MKNIFIFCFITFSACSSFAQDTIFKRSSEIIVAKIMEISPTEIKYKKFEFQDGPTYIEMKSKVQMIRYSNGMKETFEEAPKEVKTETTVVQISDDADYYSKTNSPETSAKIETFGLKYRANGKIIKEKEMRMLLMQTKDPKITSLVDQSKKAQRRQFIWIAALPLAQIGAVAALSSRSYNSVTQTYGARNNGVVAFSLVCFAGSVACPIIAVNQKHKKKSTTAAAIKLYNQKF